MRKYITVKDWCGNKTTKRMVNQSEIVDYIKNNPGKTENQIMEAVYGYYRNQSFQNNKKYAECLRRAMGKGSITRQRVMKGNRVTFIYFVLKKMHTNA
jgi:hypothetical protein